MITINNQDDFLQALDDNPQWRAAVRARILGDELLQLPVKFDAFVQRVEGFIERQTGFNEQAEVRMDRMETDIAEIRTDITEIRTDITEIRTDIAEIRTDITEIRTDITEIRTDITEIRTDITEIRAESRAQTGRIDNALGSNYEAKVERNLPSIAGQQLQLRNTAVLRGSRPDRNPEFEELVNQAIEEDRITLEESAELWLLDMVFTGRRRDSENPVYVAAESSITAGDEDIIRAAERAAILTSATGWPVTAAVICANIDEERRGAAASRNVTVIHHPRG